jgi:predicted DNA-binding transcriptional regulator
LDRDQLIGAAISVASLLAILVYGWLLYAFPMYVLQITSFIAVAGVLGIIAWIGWTMATTPPPAPIEDEAPRISSSTEPQEKAPEGKH